MSAEFNTPFELPDGWGVFSVETLIKDRILDKPLDGNHGGIHPKAADYVDFGVPFIMASDLENGRVDLVGCKFISEKQAKALRKGFSKAGDVLLSHKATIGRTAIVQDSEHDFIVLTPQVTYYRIANKKLLNNRYLKSYFDSNFFQLILGQWAGAGSTRAYLGITGQLKLPIILPPPDVQEAIAGMVGSFDDKIELNRQTNQTLEQIAQTIFKSWFVDFEPVKAKIEAKAAGRDLERAAMCAISGKLESELDQLSPEQRQQLAATAALFPDELVESELGLIPAGWKWTTFGRVTDLFDSKRIPLSKRERELRKGNFPYYGAAALMDYVDDYLFDGVHVLLAEDGSVMTPEGSPVTQYVWGRFWVNNHAHVLKGRAPVSDEHILLFLKNTNITPYINGAVQLKLNQKNMNSIPFLKASDAVLQGFSKAIAPLYDSLRGIFEQQTTLATLRDTLLPKLLSGELSVAECEHKVGSCS